VLVAHQLLPGAGPRTDLARQPRLPGGFHRGDDAEGLDAGQQAANAAGASTPLGAEAAQLFNLFVNSGNGAKDFSGIIRMLDGK